MKNQRNLRAHRWSLISTFVVVHLVMNYIRLDICLVT